MKDASRTLLLDWKRRVDRAIFMHYESSKYAQNKHLLVGVPVLVITTFVGSSIFINNLNPQNVNINMTIVTGILSFLGAILSGLQTFLNFSELAQKHEKSANDYGTLRRDIEVLLITELETDEDLEHEIQILKEKLESVSRQSLVIPKKVWDKHYIKFYHSKEAE